MSRLVRKRWKKYPDKFRMMDSMLVEVGPMHLTRVPYVAEVDLSWLKKMEDIGCKHREEYMGKFMDINLKIKINTNESKSIF